jgi:hypothetical protein
LPVRQPRPFERGPKLLQNHRLHGFLQFREVPFNAGS